MFILVWYLELIVLGRCLLIWLLSSFFFNIYGYFFFPFSLFMSVYVYDSFFLSFFLYLFIWMHRVLVAARGLSSCGMWALECAGLVAPQHVGS